MAGGFRLHGLFKDFDRVRYQLLLEEMSVGIKPADRENSKAKNRRHCFQEYQGDIGCPTGEPSRNIVFHLVCQQNIGDFRLRLCVVLRR
jgi:hypothetical protein